MLLSAVDSDVIRSAAIVGPLLIVLCGCNGKKRAEVYPVHGRVMYAGQGVPQAVVVFVPTSDLPESTKKLRPFAYADAEGKFSLKTYIDGDGAPAGKYRVCVIATSGGGRSQKDGPPAASQAQSAVAIPATVSKKYGNAETSGLEATVAEGVNNLEPFVLSPGGAT